MKNKIISTILMSALFLGGCSEAAEDVNDGVDEALNETEQAVDEVEKDLENMEQEMDGIVQNIKQNINEAEQNLDGEFVSEGEIAQLKTDSIVALTEDSYDKLYGYIDVDNVNEIVDLYDTNKVMLVEDTAKLEVLEVNLTSVKVNIIGTDETGYVHSGLLTESL